MADGPAALSFSKSTLRSLCLPAAAAAVASDVADDVDRWLAAAPPENDDEADDEAVEEEEKGVRRRLGAQTIDRFRAVIPVSANRSLIRFR